jgi:phasin
MASAPKKPPVAPAPAAAQPAPAPVATVPVPVAAPAAEFAAVDPVKAVEALAAPVREMQGNLRDAAEKGVAETRVAFERIRAAAEETTTALEASMKTAAEGVQSFNAKLVEAIRANADANFDFMKSLIVVKSFAEAIELNSEHARKSYEAFSAQSKDLSETAQKVAADAFSPLRETMTKVFQQAA